MISKFYTENFDIKRQQWTIVEVDGVDIDKSEEFVSSSFKGYKQQSNAEYAQSLGLQMTKPHIIWCPLSTLVSEGDTLEGDDGVYEVKAKQINRDGKNGHLELICEFVGGLSVGDSS